MAIQGLEQAVENLSRISKTAVPGAAAMAINRVASSAISQSASQVARETKVRRKLVKERARLKRATVKNPQARIKVILFSLGASMVLGGVAQMLAPKARTPRTQTTDNGKQNTYFSSLDNMVAQGNVLPVLYGEMRVGSRVASQEISTADEGDGGQVVVIGR